MKVPHTLLIACLGAAPMYAQQADIKVEIQKSVTTADNAKGNGAVKTDDQPSTPQAGQHHSHHGNGNRMPEPEKKPVAYIGLLTREVPAELRAQFALAEGFGLLVEEVLADSPAKAAGLKEYDVLVKLDDQQLVNMEQFMALVRAKKKGDAVQLTVITGGKETKVPITLGGHLVAAHAERHEHHGNPHAWQPHGVPGTPGFNGEMFHGGRSHGFQNPGEVKEHVERYQKELREYQERMHEWAKGGHNGPMPQPPVIKPGIMQQLPGGDGQRKHEPQTGISIPPGTDLSRFQFSQSSASANVTRSDDSGEYSVKNEDGKKTFTARPKNGPEKSWPVNTDAERQAVPQEFQDKLRMMDGANSGIRIEINPGVVIPGAPVPNNTPDGAPPVKGKTTSA